jgi:hypothetical protein
MKVLILVLSYHDNSIYSQFYDTQKETWDSEEIDEVETFYYFGNHDKNVIVGRDIFVDVNESTENCGHKTINAFELVKNLEFDYIFRTNSSSYVDKKLLIEFIKTKPKLKYYSGFLGNYNGVDFASGSGYFLSKDLVKIVLEQKNFWEHDVLDDVAIAKILFKNNIVPFRNDRFDVVGNTEIPMGFFHYRLKNIDRNFDIQTMYFIKNNKDEFHNRK